MLVSYGLLIGLNKDKMFHKCNSGEGSSGSPIILLQTCSVIGVHCGGSKSYGCNFGTLLIKSLIEFQSITNNLLVIKKNIENNNSNIIPTCPIINGFSFIPNSIPNQIMKNDNFLIAPNQINNIQFQLSPVQNAINPFLINNQL